MDDGQQIQKKKNLFNFLWNWFRYRPRNREQLLDVLRDATAHNVLTVDMLAMVERVLQVTELKVSDVMVPASQMIVVDRDAGLNTILPLVVESAHSRFPVMDGQAVAGMLLAKDLLPYMLPTQPRHFLITDILRPAIFVPQSKRLDVLLREFRLNHNHLAMVIDEYGHIAGLITIEDVLEEIVGEIEDEYDTEEEDDIRPRGKGAFSVKASTLLEDFNHYFGTTFQDDEFDTVGGLVLKKFGRLPKRGESIELNKCWFRVLAVDSRRIDLLELRLGKQKLLKNNEETK